MHLACCVKNSRIDHNNNKDNNNNNHDNVDNYNYYLGISMRTVDKKVCLMLGITQKQIKNCLVFSVASLGIHHGLHLAWHGFVERVEVLRSDAHPILPRNFFQPLF